MLRTLMIASSLLAVGAAPTAPSAAPDQPAAARSCSSDLRQAEGRRAAAPRLLGEEPSANAYLTVYRRGPDGCSEPVVVRYGVGLAPAENPRR